MDPRARWQALQTQLTLAQTQLDAGDRAAALAAAEAALALDPNFLAAHALRDRILAAPAETSPAPRAAAPLVSTDGYAQFEQRARRRRADRRIDAARAAIEGGRIKDAEHAIAEAAELDPNLPELRDLRVSFDAMRASSPARHGRWLAAAAAFVAIVLGASWLQESGSLGSRSVSGIGPLVSPPPALSVTVTAAEAPPASDAANDASPVATAGELSAAPGTGGEPPTSVVEPMPSAAPVETAAPPPPSVPVPVTSIVSAPLALPPTLPPPAPQPPDDEALVMQALQRYRSAYEGLDAPSARAIWPAVDEDALARAFEGLASQALTFDACNVTLRGPAAAATCRGTARYVPKIGSREPRSESRTWSFTLRKDGSAWMIESARAER